MIKRSKNEPTLSPAQRQVMQGASASGFITYSEGQYVDAWGRTLNPATVRILVRKGFLVSGKDGLFSEGPPQTLVPKAQNLF